MDEAKSFEFNGTWREYAPIAFTNLLLTVVTLGIYRFWATARTRRYLWSRTRFIDDQMEWAGTGLELFKGAVMVFFALVLPLLVANVMVQRLILQGQAGLGLMLGAAMMLAIFYLVGVARFRALRYRLSRSYWHGIRGGSVDPGFRYGLASMWKNFVGMVAFGLLIPWSMVSLWNERWNAMSFGPFQFQANGRVEGLMARFLLCYLAPFLSILAATGIVFAATMGSSPANSPTADLALGILTVFIILGGYFLFGIVVLAFYAQFFRQMVDATTLGDLQFGFTARTRDWIMLYLGDVALVIITLGIGTIFIGYRHWRFMVSHLHAYGEVVLDDMTQSTTPQPTQGEGLLDAFDMGAL